nr:hypothetical protein [Mucilaginibacter sp. X4EP1]
MIIKVNIGHDGKAIKFLLLSYITGLLETTPTMAARKRDLNKLLNSFLKICPEILYLQSQNEGSLAQLVQSIPI